MAINGRFYVSMEDVFPFGAYVVSEVEPVRDFDKSTRECPVQALDKETGLPVSMARRLDATRAVNSPGWVRRRSSTPTPGSGDSLAGRPVRGRLV